MIGGLRRSAPEVPCCTLSTYHLLTPPTEIYRSLVEASRFHDSTNLAMTDDNRIPDMRGDHPTLNALCELCKVNFPPVEFWPWVEKSGKSPDGVVLGDSDVKQLKGSSTAGCHLCSVLLESILPERMIAEIDDDGSVDRSTFQLLMLPDVEG